METCQFLFTKLLSIVIDPSRHSLKKKKNPTASIKSQGESNRNHFSKYLLTPIVNVNCSWEVAFCPGAWHLLISCLTWMSETERKKWKVQPLRLQTIGNLTSWVLQHIYFLCDCNGQWACTTVEGKKIPLQTHHGGRLPSVEMVSTHICMFSPCVGHMWHVPQQLRPLPYHRWAGKAVSSTAALTATAFGL